MRIGPLPGDRAAMRGVRVLDAATLIAGPLIATMFADFGADVIKIEHPSGDPLRSHGYQKDGVGLWWKFVARNKRCIGLNLSHAEGGSLFKELVRTADIVIENFRPGTLERWGLGWNVLSEVNPRLLLVRVTGFGQDGPYAHRAGFGTIAEAMSGLVHMTGDPDGTPYLPPFGMADGICALAGAWATAFALYSRDVHGDLGQVIDLALYEPLLSLVGVQPTCYDQLGVVPGRMGNRSANSAPRNLYATKDGKWVAVSSSTESTAQRVMRLVGQEQVLAEPWFQSSRGRAEHNDELDAMVSSWIRRRSLREVLEAFEEVGAAVGPVYDAKQILEDPHIAHRGSIATIDDDELGSVRIQNVMARLTETPGSVRWLGPRIGQDSADIYGEELGLSTERISALRDSGTIR